MEVCCDWIFAESSFKEQKNIKYKKINAGYIFVKINASDIILSYVF